jgi:hypothetical protein
MEYPSDALVAHLDQPQSLHMDGQSLTETQVEKPGGGAPVVQLATATVEELGERVGVVNRLSEVIVGFLGDEPASRAQRGCHAAHDIGWIAEMHQETPAEHQVVEAEFELIAGNVAPPHLYVGLAQVSQKPWIKIDRDDSPLGAHPLGEPSHH